MCVMEVRAGQRASTIAQACAHNCTTIERDCDMFAALLDSRSDGRVVALRRAQENMQRAYADLLELFGEFAEEEEAAHGVHFTASDPPGHDGTHENVQSPIHVHRNDDHRMTEQEHEEWLARANHDARIARRSETR